ncbi:exo-alpha-sialidase [Helicobacter sp. 23-1048]
MLGIRVIFIVLLLGLAGVGLFVRYHNANGERNDSAFLQQTNKEYALDFTNPAQSLFEPQNTHTLEINADLLGEMNFFNTQNVFVPNTQKSAHSSSLLDLGDRLMVVFFAGSREGDKDVKIYQSFLDKQNGTNNTWSESKPILDAQMLSRLSGKFIKKLGNPVVFMDSKKRVHLFVVGVSLGGWATSKVYQLYFDEKLQSLNYVTGLHLGAFANLSHLVRTPPLELENGGFMLPLYHELADKYPLVAFFNKDAKFLFAKRTNSLKSQLQPTIIALDSTSCLASYRIHRGYENFAFLQMCQDFGNKWGEPLQSNIKNFDSSSVLLALDKEVLLLHNDGMNNPLLEFQNIYGKSVPIHPRASLSLFLLKNPNTFTRLLTIDVTQNGEVSYPSALLDSTHLHITYTHNREKIKYLKIPLDSIDELIAQVRDIPPTPNKPQEKDEPLPKDKDSQESPYIYIDDMVIAQAKENLANTPIEEM